MNIEQLIEDTEKALSKKRATDAKQAASNKKLEEKTKTLVGLLKPVCIEAVKEMNETTEGLRIIPDSLSLFFDLKHRKVSAQVRLCDRGGNEPDEEFIDFDEPEQCAGARLRPILDRKLAEAKIPFTFGTLSVPSSYYEK